jgi:hypothetical protein
LDRFRPVTVDGRYTQSYATMFGRQQEAVRWSTEAMIAKYGDVVTKGFDGASVAESMRAEGVDVMVLYGPGYDMWVDGIAPDLQAAMARAYNRWAEEMRETSGGRVLAAGPVPLNDITRAVEEVRFRPRTARHALLLGAPESVQTAARSATATTTRCGKSYRISTSRSRPTSSWGSTGRRPAPTASRRSSSGTHACTRWKRRWRCSP